mmetsp:Transcript_81961/g.222077  ORF Transcript_81961/g.222077 Transcript_81961/m.222077 type:complete len:295 (+) Transcript_81961:60-944(+)
MGALARSVWVVRVVAGTSLRGELVPPVIPALVAALAVGLHPPGPAPALEPHTIFQPDPLLLRGERGNHLLCCSDVSDLPLLPGLVALLDGGKVHVGVRPTLNLRVVPHLALLFPLLVFLKGHGGREDDAVGRVVVRGEVGPDLLFCHDLLLALREGELQRLSKLLQVPLLEYGQPLVDEGDAMHLVLLSEVVEPDVSLLGLVVLLVAATVEHRHVAAGCVSAPEQQRARGAHERGRGSVYLLQARLRLEEPRGAQRSARQERRQPRSASVRAAAGPRQRHGRRHGRGGPGEAPR